MATYNLSSAAFDVQRQLLVVCKQTQMANDKTNLVTQITTVRDNLTAMLALANASTNVDLTSTQSATTTG